MKNYVEERRKKLKLTQEEVARKCDISLTTYRNIEKNRNIPSIEIALKLMKILETNNIYELFEL